MLAKRADICLDGCGRVSVSRGLCRGCYLKYWKRIARGTTTWEQLEAEGKVLPRIEQFIDFENKTKQCPRCFEIKPFEEFSLRRNGTMHSECKECAANDKSKRLKELRDLVNRLKDVPCADCGGRFPPVCMDFDHLDPDIKVANISRLISGGTGRDRAKSSELSNKLTDLDGYYRKPVLDRILEEAQKCAVLCSNCHRLRTYNRLQTTRQYKPKPIKEN